MDSMNNFDLMLKRFAWICVSAAGLSIIGLVGYLFVEAKKYSSRRENDRVQFALKLDSNVESSSNARVLVNGATEYSDFSKVSISELIVNARIKNGFRPAGKIDAVIYTVNRAVVEVRINFVEGFNNSTSYVVSPIFVNCDSQCNDYTQAHIELDTLLSRTHRLTEFLRMLSPDGAIHSEKLVFILMQSKLNRKALYL